MLVLIVGPSGAGKDTLLDAARAALAGDPRFRFVRRVITRPEGVGSENHEYVDPESFAMRRAVGSYALHWQAHGLSYAIDADIALDLALGRVVVASVSRAVVADAARRFPVRVIEITAPPEVLAQRLAARAREPAAAIAGRVARQVEIAPGADRVTIVNDRSVAEGAAELVRLLSRAAECARPAGTPHPSMPG